MAKRAPRKQPKQEPAHEPTRARVLTWKLSVDLEALEVTTGHDGLFRGEPEPTVLLAWFLVAKTGAPRVTPLGRSVTRFVPSAPFPCSVAPPARSAMNAKVRATDHDRIVVLAVALEEDSGKDVSAMHTLVAELARLRIWDADASEPAPVAIGDMLDLPVSTPPFSTRVHLLDEAADVRDACSSDDFVGACALVLSACRGEDVFRARFSSADVRNDWTAVLRITVS